MERFNPDKRDIETFENKPYDKHHVKRLDGPHKFTDSQRALLHEMMKSGKG